MSTSPVQIFKPRSAMYAKFAQRFGAPIYLK